jgi:chromosome partitioning protein
MIVCIGGVKGGAGKTTIAVNLAAIRAIQGYDVLLVDSDAQATATDFTVLRENTLGNAGYTCIQLTGIAVRNEVRRLAPKYDDIIIDVAGRDTAGQRAALSVADQLVIPFVPRSFDVWTISHISDLLDEMLPSNPDMKAWTFLNKADAQGNDNHDTIAILSQSSVGFEPIAISNRKAVSHAASEGLCILEYKPVNTKAQQEMMALYEKVFTRKEDT